MILGPDRVLKAPEVSTPGALLLALLAEMPELGTIDRKQLTTIVGMTPFRACTERPIMEDQVMQLGRRPRINWKTTTRKLGFANVKPRR